MSGRHCGTSHYANSSSWDSSPASSLSSQPIRMLSAPWEHAAPGACRPTRGDVDDGTSLPPTPLRHSAVEKSTSDKRDIDVRAATRTASDAHWGFLGSDFNDDATVVELERKAAMRGSDKHQEV
ncbi:hypothetical protein SKAU_G00402550 [Synaphobranchus kaupii]|uniref:Uncharacterized protein n=1 Tax=Synaphobranchus kaupii TaxID=118154 RepID=A0A9Q1E9B7_SYNKA|nr:hypothetical protein SKAU_G00402550 [Synaphobranchus kaupii]